MTTNTIYRQVERLSELLRADSRAVGLKYGLQPVQLEILHYLAMCNRFSDTPMAVVEYLGVTKGTVSQTLKVLEQKKLIDKVADAADKRSFHLKLTNEGQRLAQTLFPTSLFERSISSQTKSHQAQINRGLHLLLSGLLSANGHKTFGVCQSCRYNQKQRDGEFFCDLVKVPLSERDVELLCREHELPKSEVI